VYYGIKNMSAASLDGLAQSLWANDNVFDKYYKANGVFLSDSSWTRDYKVAHYCAITKLDKTEFDNCVKARTGSGGSRGSVPNMVMQVGVIVVMMYQLMAKVLL